MEVVLPEWAILVSHVHGHDPGRTAVEGGVRKCAHMRADVDEAIGPPRELA
jgi:hypothetical protein